MWKIRIAALLVFIAGVAVGYGVWASERAPDASFPFRLGLDLSSGVHLVYRADTSRIPVNEVKGAMNSLRDVIERRVNLFGVSEPLVQVEHPGVLSSAPEERLIVELPGVTDVASAVATIGKTPELEFQLLKKDVVLPDAPVVAGDVSQYFEPTGLTGSYVKSAELQFGGGSGQLSNEPIVVLNFNSDGAKLFEQITEQNVGRVLAIFLDDVPISTPVIQEKIPNGQATITGNFTPEAARDLVRNLNFGALPVPILLISTQTIGASLGAAALAKGAYASIFGFVFVALFLIGWYRLPGLVASVSLSMYIALILMLFKLIPVTLTAAGIAGFILSIGMAVDANILIFERMKEELNEGKTLAEAMREGFARAWPSIRDSNSSSIITAVILFWLGTTSVIKGFALVFGLGVVVSMLTAITVTRSFLLALGWRGEVRGAARFLFGNGFRN